MDTKETFAKAVLSKLPQITDVQDLTTVTFNIFRQFEQGWTVEDSVSFNMLLEEVNLIDDRDRRNADEEEKSRLEKMEAIKKKYKK